MLSIYSNHYSLTALGQFESCYLKLCKSLDRRPSRLEMLEEINQTRSKHSMPLLNIKQLEYIMELSSSKTEALLTNATDNQFPLNLARRSHVYPETLNESYQLLLKKYLGVPPTAKILTQELNSRSEVTISLDAVSRRTKEMNLTLNSDQANFIIGLLRKIYPVLKAELSDSLPTKKQLQNKISELGLKFTDYEICSALALLRKNNSRLKDWKIQRTPAANIPISEKAQVIHEIYCEIRPLNGEIPTNFEVLNKLPQHKSGLFNLNNYQQERYFGDSFNKILKRSTLPFVKSALRYPLVKGVPFQKNLIALYENLKEVEAADSSQIKEYEAKEPSISFEGLPQLVSDPSKNSLGNDRHSIVNKLTLYTAHALCLIADNEPLTAQLKQNASLFARNVQHENPNFKIDPQFYSGYYLTIILANKLGLFTGKEARSILESADSNISKFLQAAHTSCLKIIKVLD